MHVLAHAGGHTLGQNVVETLLLLAGAGLALAAVGVRNVRVFGRAGPASWGVGVLAVVALVLAFVVPSLLWIQIASVRPCTNPKITILSPRPHPGLRGPSCPLPRAAEADRQQAGRQVRPRPRGRAARPGSPSSRRQTARSSMRGRSTSRSGSPAPPLRTRPAL